MEAILVDQTGTARRWRVLDGASEHTVFTGPDGTEDTAMAAIRALSEPPSLDELRAEALANVAAAHAEVLAALTGRASPEERDTWTVKAEAARAVLAGVATPAQAGMIAAEAQGHGQSAADFAARIAAKADAYMTVVGIAGRVRWGAEAAISAAADAAGVAAALATMRAQIVEMTSWTGGQHMPIEKLFEMLGRLSAELMLRAEQLAQAQARIAELEGEVALLRAGQVKPGKKTPRT